MSENQAQNCLYNTLIISHLRNSTISQGVQMVNIGGTNGEHRGYKW